MNSEKWRPHAERLVRKLKHDHVSEANAASAEDLVEYLGLTNDRDLRSIVRFARLEMLEPIISTFDGGYLWPQGREDDSYLHCISQRRDVGRENFAVAAAIENGMDRYFGEPTLFGVM